MAEDSSEVSGARNLLYSSLRGGQKRESTGPTSRPHEAGPPDPSGGTLPSVRDDNACRTAPRAGTRSKL